jgi:hypothetical protein
MAFFLQPSNVYGLFILFKETDQGASSKNLNTSLLMDRFMFF